VIEQQPLASALDAWVARLGAEYVITDSAALQEASTSTFATKGRAVVIIRPGNRAEVQQCVHVANRFGVPLYPFSSGKNWGYGSKAPVQDGVLLDLGRLNRIIDFDEELAYVTIEPGVTQRQLFEFLAKRNSKLWMDATGASPECSIVGNTLERGFGHTPMGDHCANACAFEVVLPTGDCIETGYGRFPGAKAGALDRSGVGPSLDGLFAQSSFGIVTRMTVWLMPQPECFRAFFFSCNTERQLQPLVEALRSLRLSGTLRSVVHVGNDYKVLAGSSQYPWKDVGGRVPLDRAFMERVRRRLGIGCWNGCGGLYGTRAQVSAAKAVLRRALAGKVDRLQFVDDRILRIVARYGKPFRFVTGWDLNRTLKVLAPVYNLMKGIPTDAPLESAYWRKKTAIPASMDPDRDGCGLLWCSPTFPSTGAHAADVADVATRIVLEHGFEPQMSISLKGDRNSICVIAISYDRAVPGEDERALSCYKTLTQELLARGYPPYRLNIESMRYVSSSTEYSQVLRSLKAALDPGGILAPGRYEPGPEQSGDSLPTPPAFVGAVLR
jgi:4-cresol dehydrogenase (hydroxylating)